MSNRSFVTLEATLDGRGVLTVALNRPDVRNAFNEQVITELNEVFGRWALEPSVRAIVLKGKGAVFCAGGDLNWMKSAVNWDLKKNLEDTHRLSRLFATMNECPKPVIGAIHGAAIGGGVGIVSICDIAIGVEGTQFSLSEVRLGIVPACIGPFVIAKVGASHARGLFISAERFGTKKAAEIGLIHEVVESEQALHDAIERVLGNILQCGPNAMAIAKKLVLDLSWPERRTSISDPLELVSRVLAETRVSSEGQEGVRAFLEKRKPSWMVKPS